MMFWYGKVVGHVAEHDRCRFYGHKLTRCTRAFRGSAGRRHRFARDAVSGGFFEGRVVLVVGGTAVRAEEAEEAR